MGNKERIKWGNWK